MKWSVRYATGVEQIDQQHRMLFQMSEDYRAALDAGEGRAVYGLMLESLDDYARGHFGMEEDCMFRYQCPAAGVNIAAHGRFLAALDAFKRRFAANGFRRAEAMKLVNFIDMWLADHIARIDTQLKPCIEAESP